MNIKEFFKDKKNWFIIAFLAIIVVSLYLLYLWIRQPSLLAEITIRWFVIPVISLGIWGLFLYLVVMAIQGLLIPIPSEIVLLASGLIWGMIGGSLIGVIGSMGAGMLCYHVTLRGGRPIAEKLVGEKILKPIDNLISKYGTWFIFIARAVPMMAFDPISYVAGLLKINVKKYAIATFVGSIPRAIFYAVLGSLMLPHAAIGWDPAQWVSFIEGPEFTSFSDNFNLIFIIILVVLVGMFLVYNFILGPVLLKRGAKVEPRDGNASATTGATPGTKDQ